MISDNLQQDIFDATMKVVTNPSDDDTIELAKKKEEIRAFFSLEPEEKLGCAFPTDLMEGRMSVAREFGKLEGDDGKENVQKHACDFELGAIWGQNRTKELTIEWLDRNFPKTVEEFENVRDYFQDFLNKYSYELQ